MGSRSRGKPFAAAVLCVRLAIPLGLAACAGDSALVTEAGNAGACGPTTCYGCCRAGQCVTGDADDSCGAGGGTCLDCAGGGTVCEPTQKRCVPAGCTTSCAGKCAGADDGCGGKCAVGDCAGCCQGGVCLDGASDEVCGTGGAECADCTSQQGHCASGSCSDCTPSCAGKCAGAADGCGGLCASGECAGCCAGSTCQAGTAQDACGTGGAACASCGAEPCQNGACASCSPSCSGKCKGASDGCGGSCAANDCSGCCDINTAQCHPGTTDEICGQGGDRCWRCPDDFEGYSWKCVSQTCVHDQPTASFCQGKTGGTVSCTSGTLTGKCWASACCTGCWNSKTSTCVPFASSYADKTCGKAGATCADCTAKNEQCSATSRVCVPYTFEAEIGGVQKNFTVALHAGYETVGPFAPTSEIRGGAASGEALNVSFKGKAVGSYTCAAGQNASFGYATAGSAQYGARPGLTGSDCTVSVTQYGAVGQRIKGNFAGVMVKTISGTGPATLTIVSGSFDIIRSPDDT